MNRHASTGFLARYLAGDLSERRSAAVARHLRGCDQCSRVSEALTAIPDALASVQAPPMPDFLQARIADALATEAARRTEHGARRPGTTGRRAPGRDRLLRVPGLRPLSSPIGLAAAFAGAAAIIAGIGFGFAQLSTGPAAVGTNAGPRAAAGGGAVHAMAPAAAARPAFVQYSLDGHPVVVQVLSTSANFRPGTLARDIHARLASFGYRVGTHPAPATTAGALSNAGLKGVLPGSLPGCIRRIAAGRRIVLAEVGRYVGKPATVIVLAIPHSARVDVWVVGAGCSAARSDVLDHTTVDG